MASDQDELRDSRSILSDGDATGLPKQAVPDADGDEDKRSTGRVSLVGGGPGDPDLLTMKAIRALQRADAVLFDHLVSPQVLALAPPEARRIAVGKRGDRESFPQRAIETLMIDLARQGAQVVRLKSGDPMIFGRAAEEIAALEAAGVPFDIVPGVSAAQAMAAASRCPLTHRENAQSLMLITGRSRHAALPETIDWRPVAAGRTTLIVYMGGKKAGDVRDALLDAGADPQTPCLVMASISTPDETAWSGALAALAEGVASMPEGAPVLLGVGAVFAAPAAPA